MAHWKFESLLRDGLYLTPACDVEDKQEGHYSHEYYEAVEARFAHDPRALRIVKESRATRNHWDAPSVKLSCWTTQMCETEQHWIQYGCEACAVAIDTTVGALRAQLGEEFLIIPVIYLGDDEELFPGKHSLEPYFYKRPKWRWEEEVRVVAYGQYGKRINTPRVAAIDPSSILQVTVSPYSPNRYLVEVRAQVGSRTRSGLVGHSALGPL